MMPSGCCLPPPGRASSSNGWPWRLARLVEKRTCGNLTCFWMGRPTGWSSSFKPTRVRPSRPSCTLHTMLREYDLHDPVLQRIARVVDEADTVQEVSLEPAAAGLDLICRGLRLVSPNDQVALERGRLIYDALYAQFASEPGRE